MRKILLFVFSIFVVFQTFTSCKTAIANEPTALTITGKVTGLGKKDQWKASYTVIKGNKVSTGNRTDPSFKIQNVKPGTDIVFKCEGYDDYTCKAENDQSCQKIRMTKAKKTETKPEIKNSGTTIKNIAGNVVIQQGTQSPIRAGKNITVEIEGLNKTTKTNRNGEYKFKDVIITQPLPVDITLKATDNNGNVGQLMLHITQQRINTDGYSKGTITMSTLPQHQTETPEPDEEKVEKAKQSQEEYELAREKEKAGRVNAGISTLATGLGGYAAASSYFEQEADKKAEADMRDYLSHMYCNYSGGGVASLGETVEIPGGDELFAYYNEYRNLANNLKQTKAALNLPAGLESQVVYENSNLYQYSSRTPRSGSTASLARALMDESSEDAVAWAAQKEETAKDLRTGALVAAGGLAFGISNRIALDQKSEDNDNKKPKYEDYNQYQYKYLNTASVNENIDCKVQNITFVNQLAVTGTGGFANCDKERKEQHCEPSIALTESGECFGKDSSDSTVQHQYEECVRCKDILQRLSDCILELNDYCLRKYNIDRHKIVRDKQDLQ